MTWEQRWGVKKIGYKICIVSTASSVPSSSESTTESSESLSQYSDPSESFSCWVTWHLKQEVPSDHCSLAFDDALLTQGIKQPNYKEQQPDSTTFLKNSLCSQFVTTVQNSKLASFERSNSSLSHYLVRFFRLLWSFPEVSSRAQRRSCIRMGTSIYRQMSATKLKAGGW